MQNLLTPAMKYFLRRKSEMEATTPFPQWKEELQKIVQEIKDVFEKSKLKKTQGGKS